MAHIVLQTTPSPYVDNYFEAQQPAAEEEWVIREAAAESANAALSRASRVIAVGTTVVGCFD